MITREFNLYLHAGHSIPLVINANQYDHGEQWLFTLFNSDGTKYVPSSGAIVGIKSDNLGIINTGSVDAQGRVVINETQQMTAAVGKAVFELVIDDGTHGTANFVVLVEEKPGNNADLSETDISMIEQAIEAASTIKPYGSPLVASTVAGMTDHEKVYVYVGSETGYTSGNWYYWNGSAWASGGVYNSVAVQTDTTLTLSGVAADAKKTGDEISEVKSQIALLSGVPTAVKNALDTLFQNVAFKNDDVYTDEIAVVHNWATAVNLVSISAVYTQGTKIVTPNTSLDSLKSDLVVTANYDNGTSETVSPNAYTLSGTLTGTSIITVTYDGKTTTFTVEVSDEYLYALNSPFTSTGTDVIDTNVGFEAGKTYTFLCDHTRTGTASAVSYIYGNKSTSNLYLALQNQNDYLWGVGISWSNGTNLGLLNKRIRTVSVVHFASDGTSTVNMNYKNVTDSGAVTTFSNTYPNILENTKTVCLGDSAGTGTGAPVIIHDFEIYEGEMLSADITDYLTNGAS